MEAFDFDLTNKDLKEELEKIKQEKAKRKLKIKKKKQLVRRGRWWQGLR